MRLLFIDASTKLETVHDLKRRGRGGMVTSLFKVTDYLASRGHDVTVLSDIANTGVTKAGVKWLDEQWGDYDVLVCNRGIHDGYPSISAKARVLWTHDLPHSGFIPEPKLIRAFDRTVFMSDYSERVWRHFFSAIGKSVLIPNGIDPALFKPANRDRNGLIYASAPNRGLEKLPFIADAVSEFMGQEVRVTAYSNHASLHPNEGDDTFNYEPIKASRVVLKDPVPQTTLARRLQEAQAMVLPTAMPETCSNIVLQSLACGTPVITTGGIGSVPEYVKHRRNGMLTQFQPADYMIHTVEMVRNCVQVLEDPAKLWRMQKAAAKTPILTWDMVGRRWEKMLRRIG